jgi:putative heme iron utilization protein
MNTAQEAQQAALDSRRLLRAHRYGALCTLSKKFDGHPFGSITPYLTDFDGSLIIFISALAEHTKNIQHDPRVSLIAHNQDSPQIQTQGRVTLLGSARPLPDREQAGRRYLRYFPEAQAYFAMHDFSFYRIMPHAIRYIGGFGDIHWVVGENCLVPPYPLIEQEDSVIAHMNAEHQDALRRYCSHVHHVKASEATMVGMDCDGFDVNADGKMLRFAFARSVLDAEQARCALVEMTRMTK